MTAIENAPAFLKEFLEFKGITKLAPPQEQAIDLLMAEGGESSLVVASPTNSGKTLIGEFGIIDTALNEHKKAAYLVPLKSLAREKYAELQKYQEKYGFRATVRDSDFEKEERDISEYDLIVSTYEKFDSMTRKSPEWIEDVGIIVIDEAHMLTDSTRGAALEAMLTRLKIRYPRIRLLLLSAVMPNVEDFAKWLDAKAIKNTTWRAVELKKGVFSWGTPVLHLCGSDASKRLTEKCRAAGCGRHIAGSITFTDGKTRKVTTPGVAAEISALAVDIVKEGGQGSYLPGGGQRPKNRQQRSGTSSRILS